MWLGLATIDASALVGLDGEGLGVDGLVVADVGEVGGALVFGWHEELLLQRDGPCGIDPKDDVGEHVAHVGVFGDEIELGGCHHLAAIVDWLGAEVGDGPGFGQLAAAAAEAEGEEALSLCLIISGLHDGEVVRAGVEELQDAIFVLDEFGRGRFEPRTHLQCGAFFDEVDAAGLRGRLLDDSLVDVPAEVGLGGFELRACYVHLVQDGVQVCRLGLSEGGDGGH